MWIIFLGGGRGKPKLLEGWGGNYNMSRGLPLGKLDAEVLFEPWPTTMGQFFKCSLF